MVRTISKFRRKYFKQLKPCDGINATEYLGDVCNGLSNCTAAFNEGEIFTNAPDVCKPKTREYATYEWWCVPEIFRPCVNSEGSYECICPREYIQNQTTKECDEDVDECLLKTHECHPDATCENIWGGYNCTCPPGTVGNGMDCIDIKCPFCGENAICIWNITNLDAECVCETGYEGDGYTCEDIDECLNIELLNDCNLGANETCINSVGSYECTCGDGFKRNTTTGNCEDDVDECVLQARLDIIILAEYIKTYFTLNSAFKTR